MVINKTTLFVLPMLELDMKKEDYKKNLYSCYLFVKGYDIPKNHIALCYSSKPLSIVGAIDVFIQDNKYFVIYPISSLYIDDFQLFLEGKYSKFSLSLKTKIGIYYGFSSTAYKGVTKDPGLRKKLEEQIDCVLNSESEIISIYDINNEKYN